MRRDAVGELGAALRDLVDAAVRTEVSLPELAGAAAVARELAGRLRKESRELHEIASVDDPQIGERWYSPVYGPGNPVAPPMVATDTPDGRATGRVTLGNGSQPTCGLSRASRFGVRGSPIRWSSSLKRGLSCSGSNSGIT